MGDPYGKITSSTDLIGKIQGFFSGFLGYAQRENRRDADQILRETLAQRYEEQWSRLSELQKRMVSEGKLEQVDDVEAAAVKLRGFIDRIRHASYGYAGFFDRVRINEPELTKIYEYDLALLEDVSKVSEAIDHIEASMGSDGFPAAVRNLTAVAQDAVDALNRREEVILSA
jgi:hypothetical protein